MSATKEFYHNHIYVMSCIKNRNYDYLYGTILTVGNKSVYIDDFIETDDGGLMVCIIVTDKNSHETYAIINDTDFLEIVYVVDTVILPDVCYA